MRIFTTDFDKVEAQEGNIVSIPPKWPINFQRSSDILFISPEEIAMRKIRFTDHQIIAALKSVEVDLTVKDVRREAAISPSSCYNWKAKYSRLEAADIKKIKDLEEENLRLKLMFSDLSLECRALKDVMEKSFKTSDKARARKLSDHAIYDEHTPGM